MSARHSVTISMLITVSILVVSQGWIGDARDKVKALSSKQGA